MGKKRALKDRAYITASEWREEGGGHKGRLQGVGPGDFKRLPFHCCAITFQPFEDPVAAPDGTVMDIVNAVPYITRHKRHPVTGQPLALADLVRLHFHKNADGEYACPVLNKVFNDHTHIVAVRPSGNVYCWEAIQELCIKPKNMRDLITDEPFTRKDILHIQDPLNLSGKNLATFDHVVAGRSGREEEGGDEADAMAGINTKALPSDVMRTLAALGSDEAAAAFAAGGGGKKAQAERALAEAKAKAKAAQGGGGQGGGMETTHTTKTSDPRLRSEPRQHAADLVTFKPGTATWNTDAADGNDGKDGETTNATAKRRRGDPNAGRTVPPPYSATWIRGSTTTGAASKSFTSTSMPVATKNERTMVLQQLKPAVKGYVRLHTSLGDLNLELHCDLVPKTCENFFALASNKYYDGVSFHRSIKNFMIQGGDPTGTGTGGASVFGATFEDEIDSRLVHDARGVLSMANSGPNTNGSQFFITYKPAPHLNFKHTVFGRVVGGFETLTAMERVPTDDEDRPLQPITITGATVYVNPYTDMLEEAKKTEEKKKVEEMRAAGVAAVGAEMGAWFTDAGAAMGAGVGVDEGRVGKYLKLPAAAGGGGAEKQQQQQQQPSSKKDKSGAPLVNFDAW